MDDIQYAAKYADGAEPGDLFGKAKQAIDARHVEGLGGLYIGGVGQFSDDQDKPMFGGEIGYEFYPKSYFSHRMGAMFLFNGDLPYIGFDLGARLQSPTRFAPFVGLGTFQGILPSQESAIDDRHDNDDDGIVDEADETEWTIDSYTASIYPEFGAHLWINGSGRATVYTRYLVTSAGRDQDQWVLGGQMVLFSR
jgi:hypothetical protein